MRIARLLTVLGALAAVVAPSASAEGVPERPDTRQVMFVGNNWEGTADVIDQRTFRRLARINVIPDLPERLRETWMNPVSLGYFLAIRELVGEGNHQYVDDMFSSHDGRFLYVSRPSLRDVVGIDLRTREIVWRIPVEGYRADHMAISPDGSRLLVSASTANKVHVIDPRVGRLVGEFASGDSPHENTFSRDGRRIYHASIGLVYTPADLPIFDSTKGERVFQVVDAETLKVVKRLDVGKIMAAHGYPGMSAAVRPMAITPDERVAYMQLSFLHGFVEFDLTSDRPLRVAQLPLSEEARRTPREGYLLDSAHHGLALNGRADKLCVAGTMSDYAAIVSRADFAHRTFDVGRKPYWATTGADGTSCWVSSSGDDRVVVIDYDSEREIARMPVGDHPQRIRPGAIQEELVAEGTGMAVTHKPSRRGVGILRNRIRIGCRAQGAALRRCDVRLRGRVRGARQPVTLGRGATATATGQRVQTVTVRLTRAGRALLRRRPGGFRASIVATGTDALGGRPVVVKRTRFRRGT